MKIRVHEFRMSDVEDVDIYAAEPIYNWQQTEQGKWIMDHATAPPTYHIKPNLEYVGYIVTIIADLKEEDMTYFYLRWK